MNKNSNDTHSSTSRQGAYMLNLLMDHLPYSIFFKDKESKFIKINRECAEKFGLESPEEAIGNTDFDFFDEEHARQAYEDEQEIIKTGKPEIDKLEREVSKTSDSDVQWALTSKFPLPDPQGNIIGTFGITRDVTKRVSAEQELKKSEDKYRSIFENIQDVIYRTDLEGIVTDITPSIEKYSGYKRENIIGKPVANFYFFKEDREKLIKQLRKSGAVSDFEIRLKTSDDKLVYASINSYMLKNDDGEVIGVEGIMRDITERKEAERLLQDSADTLEKFSRLLPGSLYKFARDPEGNYSLPYFGYGIQKMLESITNEKQVNFSSLVKSIHKDDLDSFLVSIEESYQTLSEWRLDFRVQNPNPALGNIWLRGRSQPEKLDDGSIIWYGYLSDITEEKQKVEEMNRTLDIVSDQNKRLVNFAHIVSHNLRNHAGNFTMLLSLLDNDPSDEERDELLGYMQSASDRLNETIKDLNEIVDQQAEPDKGIKELNFREQLSKTKEVLSTEIISNKVTFKEEIAGKLTIHYNSAYLESILLNLVSNAIKYRHPDRNPVIEIKGEKTETGISFSISDNGQGIDLEKHGKQLFGMYKTFHGNDNSKGIGLYITKNQIESFGGSIEVESEPGKGTTFNIHLVSADNSVAVNE